MTSEQIQARISANAQEQQEVRERTDIDGREKTRLVGLLHQEQDRLYRLRDQARRAEQGRAPRERVGVGY